jgi:PTS system mannose-specific IIB component/fructoselysine and glucoselysine-specific PTS system IIB component
MPVVLYRVDDRLVHGQVVIGWGKPLDVGFIALVDDTVASSEWERDLYRMGVPADLELRFAGIAEARRELEAWRKDPRAGIVLTADVPTMVALCQAGSAVARVNLGGIHHRPGRTPRLPYVYLSDEEFRMLETLAASGTEVTAQDLPTSSPVPLDALR